MGKLMDWICKNFCQIDGFPVWAYGLECGICKMSFGTAQLHYNYVCAHKTDEKHKGKIPILREK